MVFCATDLAIGARWRRPRHNGPEALDRRCSSGAQVPDLTWVWEDFVPARQESDPEETGLSPDMLRICRLRKLCLTEVETEPVDILIQGHNEQRTHCNPVHTAN